MTTTPTAPLVSFLGNPDLKAALLGTNGYRALTFIRRDVTGRILWRRTTKGRDR